MSIKQLMLAACIAGSIHVSNSQIKYSSAWFGPNANPVPEFTDGTIPAVTTLTVTGDYYFGYGDETKNSYVKAEIPLLPKRVSLKVWSTYFEHYSTTDELKTARGSAKKSGFEGGDLYVQTRISLLSEQKNRPAIIVNSTLKTAATKTVTTRRYFDTPGYYFDLEVAKGYELKGSFLNKIRLVGNLGFMSWETTNSLQDDAPMYGIKVLTGNGFWTWENTFSGYYGWLHTSNVHNPEGDYGDAPMVVATKLSVRCGKNLIFGQYQHGIKDFPYEQIRLGISIPLEKLTPKFKP